MGIDSTSLSLHNTCLASFGAFAAAMQVHGGPNPCTTMVETPSYGDRVHAPGYVVIPSSAQYHAMSLLHGVMDTTPHGADSTGHLLNWVSGLTGTQSNPIFINDNLSLVGVGPSSLLEQVNSMHDMHGPLGAKDSKQRTYAKGPFSKASEATLIGALEAENSPQLIPGPTGITHTSPFMHTGNARALFSRSATSMQDVNMVDAFPSDAMVVATRPNASHFGRCVTSYVAQQTSTPLPVFSCFSTPPPDISAALARTSVQGHAPAIRKGDLLSVNIDDSAHQLGVREHEDSLIARVLLKPKSASAPDAETWTSISIRDAINNVWQIPDVWQFIPLGKGYYLIHINDVFARDRVLKQWIWQFKFGTVKLQWWTP